MQFVWNFSIFHSDSPPLHTKQVVSFLPSFSLLKLFNIEAKDLKLEVKVEDQVVDSFPVSLSAQFPNAKAFFPKPYNNKMAVTDAFITSVNNYFDSQKPEFAMQRPFFRLGGPQQ